ncbi:MAG: DUF3047 domain-containing protein [Alphaproteobacteria bacterium]
MRSLCALILAVAALPALAASLPEGSGLEGSAWRLWTLASVPPTRFTSVEPGRIDITAEASFGLIYRSVSPDERAKAKLVWRWRVDRTIPPTDLSRRVGDDRPLAIHVWFPDVESGLFSRLARALGHTLAGVPLSGKVITYVWGGEVARDTVLPNPHMEGDGVLIVLRGAGDATGAWAGERVDWAADFQRAFGREAPPPTHLAISADTDDGRGRAAGVVTGLAFAE